MTGSILISVVVAAFVLSMGFICSKLIEKMIDAKIKKFRNEVFEEGPDVEAEAMAKAEEQGEDLLWDGLKDWVQESRDKAGWNKR